jgi:glycine cleavage system aminomethyltransferase T
VIGLAWLPPERTEDGTRFEIRVDRRTVGARVRHGAFYDPGGERMRA